ncbi:MAG: hypothetical protein P1S60_11785 [Anaerolineae bacterium]|nr:hypothetical protein [Anaerolineae bacterium]
MMRVFYLCIVAVVLLSACSWGGPTNKEVKDIVYGVYLQDASIRNKIHCPIAGWLEEEDHTSVWLVTYRFKGNVQDKHLLLSEQADHSWTLLNTNVDACPE